MSFKTFARISTVVVAGLLMSACSRENPFVVTVDHCPAISVVGDLGSYTRIKDDSGLASDVEYTATVSNVRNVCASEDNVMTDITFDISAVSGPANKSSSVTIEYYILTLRDNSQLVSKNTYSVNLQFGANGRAVKNQSIRHVIPSVDRARRYDYELMIGLKMTPNETMRNIER